MKVASDGSVSQAAGVSGLSGLNDPVDLVEDPATGNLYVSELGAQRITLLRVHNAAGAANAPSSDLALPVDTAPDDSANLPSGIVAPAATIPAPITPSTAVPGPAPETAKKGRKITGSCRRIQRLARRYGLPVPNLASVNRRTLRMIIVALRGQADEMRIPGAPGQSARGREGKRRISWTHAPANGRP